jgi:hypothetical protein
LPARSATRGEAEILRDLACLIEHDAMWYKPGVDVARHPAGVIGQRHGSTVHDKHIRDDATAGKALTEGRESLLQLGSAEQNIARVAHAASKSAADK